MLKALLVILRQEVQWHISVEMTASRVMWQASQRHVAVYGAMVVCGACLLRFEMWDVEC